LIYGLTWAFFFLSRLAQEYGLSKPLKAIFIDTFYDPDNPEEVNKFEENTESLFR